MIAGDLMTPDPITVTPETSIAEVWDLMRLLHSRHIPVVEEGALVGIVSDRDLLRLDLTGLLPSEEADLVRQELAGPVAKIMSIDVVAVDTETELFDVVGLLIEHRVGALPVVRPGTRDVVGILSYIDVLKVVQDALRDAE
jgi:CBS domain-containing protein